MAKRTSTKKLSRKMKVWHIFRFKERFELPDDFRKCRATPLLFTKDFVGVGAGDEAAGYENQFRLLSNGDGLEDAMSFGLYRKLINLAACHSRAKRGYLLDAKDQPLSTAQIAKLLNVPTKKMNRILKRFAAVHLLEHVDLPEFDLSQNDPLPSEDKRSDDPRDGGGDTKKPASRGRKQGSSGNGRKRAEISDDGCVPLKSGKGKGKRKEETANGNDNKKEKERQKSNATDASSLKGKGQAKTRGQREEPPQTPATTPPSPLLPTQSDAGGSDASGKQAHPKSVRFDVAAAAFAAEIYEALQLRWPRHSPEAARELGAFASLWCKAAASGIPPPQLGDLRVRAIGKAQQVAKRKSCRKPGAVWCKVFGEMVEKAK